MSSYALPLQLVLSLLVLSWSSGTAAQPSVRLEDPKLTLTRAAQIGAERNLALLSQRLLEQQAERAQRAAWVNYTPTLVLNADVGRERPLFPETTPRPFLEYSGGILWRAPTGTAVSLQGTTFQTFSGEGNDAVGELILAVTQPLLRNGWLTGGSLALRESRLLSRIQREQFRQALNALLVEVESAYWDLAVAEADRDIKTRSRDRARQQFEDTRENIRRGILAESEIYVVEENVVFFDQELLQAEENLRRARRRLAELLLLDPDTALTAGEALTRPAFELPEREAAVSVALLSSPRLQAQQVRVEFAEERRRWAWNQTLPALDLSGQLTMVGEDPRPEVAWSGVLVDQTPRALVGLAFSLPLDRGGVTAQYETAQLEAQRAKVDLASAENEVRFGILNALTGLETNISLLQMAEKQVELAELKLQAETEKYQSGISTLNDVVRFQRDLDNALIRVQRVIRSIHVGRAQLLAAQGTLHETMGVGVGR